MSPVWFPGGSPTQTNRHHGAQVGPATNSPPPFTPTSLSGLTLWLDANDGGTITQSGGAVSQWNDKSTSANNATQTTAANQPGYSATALNSKPAVTFSGSPVMMNLTANIDTTSGNLTFFVVNYISGNAAAMTYFGSAAGSNFLVGNLPAGGGEFYTGSPFVDFNYIYSLNQPFIYGGALKASPTTAVAYLNGVAQSDNGTRGTSWSGGGIDRLGIRTIDLYLVGGIGEILIYNRDLTGTELSQVNTYLTNKWSIS